MTRDDDGVYYCHAALYSSVAESAVELRVDGKLQLYLFSDISVLKLECYSTEITSPCLELPVPVIVKVTSLQSLPVPAGSPMRFLCEASTHCELALGVQW